MDNFVYNRQLPRDADRPSLDRENFLKITDTHGVPGSIPYDGQALINAGQSGVYTFRRHGRHVLVQNNSSSAINVAFDGNTSPGTFLMPAGATYRDDRFIQNITIIPVTGSITVGTGVANNVFIEAWD